MKKSGQLSVVSGQRSGVWRYALTACLSVIVLAGCATVPVDEDPASNIVWPRPPDRPKIRFVRAVSKSEDLRHKKEKGWFEKGWGFIAGETAEKVLVAPYGVAVEDGNIFVVDRDTREVSSFNLRTGKTFSFSYDSDEESPIGIGLAQNVYVSYPDIGLIRVFSKKGKFEAEFGTEAKLKRPTGIGVNLDKGLLYVADTSSHDIKVFDLSGNLAFSFGKRGEKDGELNYPTHVFVDRSGTVYVTDEMNFRIQAFASDGKFLFKFGQIGTVPGTFQSPKGVAADSEGNIYVADTMSDSIQIFDRAGRLLLFFGGGGSEEGLFWSPAGVFIDKNDRIYITDLYNRRVQIFQYLK